MIKKIKQVRKKEGVKGVIASAILAGLVLAANKAGIDIPDTIADNLHALIIFLLGVAPSLIKGLSR